jgi:ribosomal protein S18 acetylase RimI-like enzyme
MHGARADFLFLVAREAGELVGFGYGYTGAYGQWWTERVALSLTAEQRAEWLDPPHYEVVELHVDPQSQRGGVGSLLLERLLSGLPHRRALLSTQVDNAKARPFYEKHGWQVVVGELSFGPGYAPFCVYGKRL